MFFDKKKEKKEIIKRKRHNNTTEIQGRCPQDVEQPETKAVRSSETLRAITVQIENKQTNKKKSFTFLCLCIKPPTVPPRERKKKYNVKRNQKKKKKLVETKVETQHDIYYTT